MRKTTVIGKRLHIYKTILSCRSNRVSSFIYWYCIDFSNVLLKYLKQFVFATKEKYLSRVRSQGRISFVYRDCWVDLSFRLLVIRIGKSEHLPSQYHLEDAYNSNRARINPMTLNCYLTYKFLGPWNQESALSRWNIESCGKIKENRDSPTRKYKQNLEFSYILIYISIPMTV